MGPSLKPILGEFIKQRREQIGLTQKDLSEKLGYTNPQYISNIERGICSMTPKQAAHFSKALEISCKTMFEVFMAQKEQAVLKEFNCKKTKGYYSEKISIDGFLID